ncbi:MAG: type IV pilus assembly protein PilN [Gammaproteobacteria bacterium]|nr:MAG: type IV pilus assembly protein PilN [Gammaproteobacteria bacterium]TND03973.1 MAG: type IV pilus assembly protein PilN [Gammaproteobacteria bacterium]
MTQINLLPWRESRRKEAQRQFASVAAGAVVLMGLTIFYVHWHVSGLMEQQQARNEFLKKEIEVVDKKIGEIKELESARKKLVARMEVVQQLQSQRPRIVYLFREIVNVLPDGVYLTSVKQVENALTVEGIAQSNARVSTVMRNVDASEWLDKPRLEVIETAPKLGDRSSRFQLSVKQTLKTDSQNTGTN